MIGTGRVNGEKRLDWTTVLIKALPCVLTSAFIGFCGICLIIGGTRGLFAGPAPTSPLEKWSGVVAILVGLAMMFGYGWICWKSVWPTVIDAARRNVVGPILAGNRTTIVKSFMRGRNCEDIAISLNEMCDGGITGDEIYDYLFDLMDPKAIDGEIALRRYMHFLASA